MILWFLDLNHIFSVFQENKAAFVLMFSLFFILKKDV